MLSQRGDQKGIIMLMIRAFSDEYTALPSCEK
jgi:hypothetical protein